MSGMPLQAQEEAVETNKESWPFYKRISFHTNVVDWALTTPNFGVEVDLQGTEETRFSLLVNGKFNWNTDHIISPRLVWNIQSGAVELRKYWRTSSGGKKIEKRKNLSWFRQFFPRFQNNVLAAHCMEKPRYWRAYYVGFYAGMDKFTYCLGKNGKQGSGINAGISAGYSIPLYPFKNGKSLDLDMGAIVVAKLVQYDKFRYEEESACYAYAGTKGRHLVPYPVLHDIHVSLVYRFNSIANKVKGGDKRGKAKWEDRLAKVDAREEKIRESHRLKDSVHLARHEADSLLRIAKDAEKLQKKMMKDSLEREKMQRKLFKQMPVDSAAVPDSVEVEALDAEEKIREAIDSLVIVPVIPVKDTETESDEAETPLPVPADEEEQKEDTVAIEEPGKEEPVPVIEPNDTEEEKEAEPDGDEETDTGENKEAEENGEEGEVVPVSPPEEEEDTSETRRLTDDRSGSTGGGGPAYERKRREKGGMQV